MQRGVHFDLSVISDCDPDKVMDFVLRRSRLVSMDIDKPIVRSRWGDLWHLFFPMPTGEEKQKIRKKQIMQLARYGRQSIFGWDDVCIFELEEWIEALGELIKAENASAPTEDH